MKKFIHIIALLVLCTASMTAQRQSFEGYIEAAEKAESKDDFYNAYKLYDIATQFTDARNYEANIAEVRYKAGVAAYRATAYGVAQQQLEGALALPEERNYPLLKYYLAQSLFCQGNYDAAAVLFQTFLEEQPGADPAFRSAAQAQINDSDWAIDAMSRAEDITLVHLPEGINSVDSDVMYTKGPGGDNYFTSNRFSYKNDTIVPKRMLSRILQQTGAATAEPLSARINLPNKSVAHSSFNRAGNQVYFSICDFRNYDDLICDLYRSEIAADGSWGEPQKLSVNQDGVNTTQPSVGFDGTDGREYLFFASDRSGGQGGLDLYRAPIADDGSIGAAENLEYLNTPGEDATPFWYAPRQTLYFSTDGRFSFGGLDIYRSYWIDGTFRRPINLGAPVNSSSDEAYYTRFDDEDKAYVASRRPGPEALFYTGEREVCCYELYEFTPDPRIDLLALTFNKLTQEELSGATVTLHQITEYGQELLIETITNPDSNDFNFLVLPDMKYKLTATKDGYSRDIDSFDLSTPEFENAAFIERKLYLAPEIELDVFTFNNQDSTELPGATVMLFEVAENGGETLIESVDNPAANDFHFRIEFGKNYVVRGGRAGYGEDFATVDVRNYDGAQGATIRRDLYFGPALEVYVIDGWTEENLDSATIRQFDRIGNVIGTKFNAESNDFYYTVNLNEPLILNTRREGYYERTDTLTFTEQDLIDSDGTLIYYVPLYSDDPGRLLPFEVYYDNDYPNPRTTRTTTDKTYPDTYFPYLERKEEFREEFVADMSPEDAFLVRGSMDQFFEQEVEDGYRQLLRFAEALLIHSRNGGSFVVELRGFASPRAASEYNRRLSARRNVAVENFFRSYKNGELLPYFRNGQLAFTEAALGESTADTQRISDRLDRPRESIFSIIASLERRVELGKAIEQKK